MTRDTEERPPFAVARPKLEHRSHQEADGAGPGRVSRTLGGAPALRRPFGSLGPYPSQRSPPSLFPSVAKLATQKVAEPASQNPEVVWGREPEASRTSTARPRQKLSL